MQKEIGLVLSTVDLRSFIKSYNGTLTASAFHSSCAGSTFNIASTGRYVLRKFSHVALRLVVSKELLTA